MSNKGVEYTDVEYLLEELQVVWHIAADLEASNKSVALTTAYESIGDVLENLHKALEALAEPREKGKEE